MPALVGLLMTALFSMIGSFVGKILASLGIAVVTYKGIDVAFGYLKGLVITNLNALPVVVVQLLAYMKVGTAISILFACMFANMLLTGLNSDKFTKWIHT